MRHDNYAEDLYRLDNEYRGLMIQIRSIHRRNNDEPSREEGKAYQRAAEICAAIANMSVGAEAEHWKEEQAKCSEKIREIAYALDPEAAKKIEESRSEKSSCEAPEKASNESSGDWTYGVETNEVVTKEMVKAWFKDAPSHGFDDVAGMEEVKKKLRKCFTGISMGALRERLKIKPIQSFFFVGPPGCGKTYIINAFAHELIEKNGYKYMFLSGGNIHNRYVGDAEKVVEKAFLAAKANAPCILFIDEMDGVCRNRNAQNLPAHMFSTTTAFLNGYNSLTENMDPDKPVIFMAATNYPQNVDAAMLDRTEIIEVSLPDDEARASAFGRGLKHLSMEEDISYEDMAQETVNYNYRDIDRLIDSMTSAIFDEFIESGVSCEEAVEQLNEGSFKITRKHFDNAFDNYTPTPKEEYMKELEAWKNSISQ